MGNCYGKIKDWRFYDIWRGMKSRCFKKSNSNYKNYGGKGITVNEKWLNYDNFYNVFRASQAIRCPFLISFHCRLIPSLKANIVKSRPKPTLSAGFILVPL